jgi:hypothetical protein
MDRETHRENDSEPRRQHASENGDRNQGGDERGDLRTDEQRSRGAGTATPRTPLTSREQDERWPIG